MRTLADRLSPSPATRSARSCSTWPGGVGVPVPPLQNWAICVWSAVRVEPVAEPSVSTWLRSAAHSAEPAPAAVRSAATRASALVIANGVTLPHCGSIAGWNIGAVGDHWPGCEPPSYSTKFAEPSFARNATMVSAMVLPSADAGWSAPRRRDARQRGRQRRVEDRLAHREQARPAPRRRPAPAPPARTPGR